MDENAVRVKAFNSQPSKYRKGAVMANQEKPVRKTATKPRVKTEDK